MKLKDNNSPSVLLCDHACHDHTHSFDFFINLLATYFPIRRHRYERIYRYNLTKAQLAADPILIYHQFLPGRMNLAHPGKRAVYIPMYDNEWGSRWMWRRIALWNLPIIAFSKRILESAKQVNCTNILPLHFFPKPEIYTGLRGDPSVLLLWDRGQAGLDLIQQLFAPGDFREIIILRHPEDNVKLKTEKASLLETYHVTLCEKPYLPREEFLQLFSRAGVFLAPRYREGIGHPYLEAMSMGKVVIANQDGTMDEYIEHGVNGWLVNYHHPTRLPIDQIRALHSQLPPTQALYERWLAESATAPSFISNLPRIPRLGIGKRLLDLIYHGLTIVEYGVYLLKRRFIK